MGTKKLILVPMGTKVPKWGPTWEQWGSRYARDACASKNKINLGGD